ncbi:guanine deaminase [Viridothelium virens]|uniref:Guanine deaminase n=1 Tax=Viridothelium virens TaxID=1048519 RepID=A0A6A6HEA1_VIRVR|nr:guanine deaminase [Viridothelium virens]
MGSPRRVYVGAFAHCKSLEELDICDAGAIGVGESGRIEFIERDVDDISSVLEKQGWKGVKVVKIKDHGFFFPGFIDTHIHAPQYPNAGIFGKTTLIDWLDKYTFPMEASFSSLARARQVYNRIVNRTLSHGTTTAAYYATVHVPATNLLADICHAKHQRAFIGRVCMDTMSPPNYRDTSPEDAVAATRATIQHITSLDPSHSLLIPIITPRFAPSCTPACLSALGRLHKETNLPIQTHIAENHAELDLVRRTFPSHPSYTAVYDDHGLLGPRTVLAHAVHLSPAEVALIRARGAKVSHCPASNTALTSGAAKVRELLLEDITIGLGTDVSGGYSPSVLVAARHAVMVSRHVAMGSGEGEGDAAKLTEAEVLWLATRGGARALGLEERVGGFEVGMEWDAQMVVLGEGVGVDGEGGEAEGPVDVFGWESWEERIAKWLYNGDDRNTAAVWVKGELVHKTQAFSG